jgi:putative ABC transport system permease protein
MTGMESASSILAAVIFIFLIIFSAKTQFTSLMERFREIGILKSLGWSNSALGSQVIFISVFQALAGAFAGIVSGWLLIMLMNSLEISLFNNMKFQFQASGIPILLLLSLTGGLIAGIFPIIKLSQAKAGEMINNYM